MILSYLRFSLLSLFSLAATLANAFTPSEDGLYAVFDTSSGEFTARLHFEQAP